MMNPLRAQIASLIINSAQAGLERLDKNSELAHKLKSVNADVLLKDYVNKFCNEMSYSEMGKIAALAAQMKCRRPDKAEVKETLKKIAKKIVGRVEKKSGDLNVPVDLRDLLFNL